jgi:hypothetical protein
MAELLYFSLFIDCEATQPATMNGMAQGLIPAQQPDGSYRYDGPYRRGHFENT